MARKKSKTQRQRKPVPRTTRKFQLRRDNSDDMHVAEILDYCRSQRLEAKALREGVILWWALKSGDLNVLFELFPQYKSQFGTQELLNQFMAHMTGQGSQSVTVTAPRPELPTTKIVYDQEASLDNAYESILDL